MSNAYIQAMQTHIQLASAKQKTVIPTSKLKNINNSNRNRRYVIQFTQRRVKLQNFKQNWTNFTDEEKNFKVHYPSDQRKSQFTKWSAVVECQILLDHKYASQMVRPENHSTHIIPFSSHASLNVSNYENSANSWHLRDWF